MLSTAADPSRPRRRRARRWAIILGAMLAVVLLLIALAPTLVSMGLGRGAILGAINRRINGTANISSLSVGWFSEQRVEGLAITDPAGRKVVDVSLIVPTGLLKLALGSADPLQASIGGRVVSDVRENGSTSLGDLLKRDASGPSAAAPPPQPLTAPSSSTGRAMRAASVDLTGLAIELHDATSGRTLQVTDLKGRLAIAADQAVSVQLASPTVSGPLTGSVDVSVDLKGLLGPDGSLAPAGASAVVTCAVRNVPVLGTDRDEVIQSLDLSVRSGDLTRQAEVAVNALIAVAGAESGRVDGTLTIDQPMQSDGSVNVDVSGVSGTITASGVPTAMLQPFLVGTPIIAAQDIGPTLNATARFSGGAAREVDVNIAADNLNLALTGQANVTDRSLEGRRLHVQTTIRPALIEHYAGCRVDRPVTAQLTMEPFTLPAIGGDTGTLVRGFAGTTTMALGPSVVQLPGGTLPAMMIDGVSLSLKTASLAEALECTASTVIDGVVVRASETIRRPLGDDLRPNLETIAPEGAITVAGDVRPLLTKLAPEQGELIAEVLGDQTSLIIKTQAADGALRAESTLVSRTGSWLTRATREPSAIRIQTIEGSAQVTPRLAELLQMASDKAMTLADATTVRFTIEPFDLPASAGRYTLPSTPLTAQVMIDHAIVGAVPGLAEPLQVRLATLRVQAPPRTPVQASVQLQTELWRPAVSAKMSRVALQCAIDQSHDQPLTSLQATVDDLSVTALEGLLGRPPQSLADWLGAGGSVTASLAPRGQGLEGSIDCRLEQLKGEFTVAMDEQTLTVSSTRSQLAVSQGNLQRLLTPAPAPGPASGGGPSAAAAPMLVAQGGVTITPSIKRLRLPLAIVQGQPFDPAAVEIDIALESTPLSLRHQPSSPPQDSSAAPMLASLQGLTAAVTCRDLRHGLQFSLRSQAEHSLAAGQRGQVQVDGTLTDLVGPDGTLQTARSHLQLTASATDIATAIVDAVANMNGLLAAALGPQLAATATATDFSATGGSLVADLKATHGFLRGTARGREHALLVTPDQPFQAELDITPPLRQRLLARIHPVLADIRTTKQPLRATLSADSLPLDGDISRLNADLDITIGEVEFDGGSTTLFFLALFDQAKGRSIPGSVDPIRARIRNGIVTYDQFAIRIDKYVMQYQGRIDLPAQTLDIRTGVPMDAFARTFQELEGFVEGTVIPVRTSGSLSNPRTEPDFSELLKQAVPRLLEKQLGDLLKKIPK